MRKPARKTKQDKSPFFDSEVEAVKRRIEAMSEAEYDALLNLGQRDLEAAVRHRARKAASENRKAQAALAALRKRAA